MTALLFRPQNLSKPYTIRERRLTGKRQNYSFQHRHGYVRDLPPNKVGIARRFGQLHYLAWHSPKPVAKRWVKVYNAFERKYFAAEGRASIRYLNTWTAHSWL